MPASTQREHQRILAAYGGAYEDSKLEADAQPDGRQLLAASERPDMQYRITILNSPAVNTFALPSGKLYVTRGLIALANDTSELAQVLSRVMSHVITRQMPRRNEARQVALVTRVIHRSRQRSGKNELALAKSKIKLASFSRAQELEADGIGIGIAARGRI